MEAAVSTTYTDKIYDIAIHTFEIACFMFPLEEGEVEDNDLLERPNGTSRSVVKFDGAARGAMVIDVNKPLLNAIAVNMLGEENVSREQKEGALCEITNIICGNTVPLFAKQDHICIIHPPRMAHADENELCSFKNHQVEKLQLILDEGIADISIFYTHGDPS